MAKVSSEGGEVNISSIAKSTNEIKSNDKMEPILNSNKFTSLEESNQEEDEILYKDADNSSNSILQLSSSDSESTSTQCSCKSSAMKEESKRKRENKYFSKLNELATENKVFRNSIENLIENTDAYFSWIFEKDWEPLINNDMLNLIIASLRVGQCENLIKLFKIELIEKDDNSISWKVDPKWLKDSSKYFPFTLKLVSIKGNEKVTLNIVENVIKNRKRMHTENCEDDKANSDQAISSEQSLNPFNHDNPSMTNRALCMNIELMKDHASFKEFIQQYYFNWWRYIFSLIVENSILNKESLESLYIYIWGVLMKGREMLKDESSNTFGPHISLFKIKKMFNIIDKTENFSFYKRLKEYNKRYSAEANDSLNKIKEQLEKLSEEKQINISDIKIDRNSSKESKKLRRLKLWTLLRRIERDWSNTNDCRGQKLFWRGIDYTFTSGTSLEYEVPDMQNTRIIIPEDCKLEVLKDLTALQIQIVSQQKLIEVNEEQSWKEKDRRKLKAAPPNLLKIKASKGTNSCLKKVKKQNLDYYDIEWDEQASIISNVLISYVTKLKNKSSSYLKDLSIINGFSWFKLNEWNKKISNHIEGVNKLTTDKLESLELKTDAWREDWMNQIGEIVYGSYSKLLSNGAKSTNDKKNLKSIIHKRNLAILYILKHPVLPCKEEIKSVNDIMSFIIYEMEENERNLSKEGTVGEQCDIFLTKESILNYPFETLMKWNSTKARLFVMENWERFVCLASFANQREYKHVFGFVNLFESSLSGNQYLFNLLYKL